MQVDPSRIASRSRNLLNSINSGFVDQLVVFYAPTMLGSGALPALATGVALPPIQNFTLKRFDEDFAFAGYLRDPWAGID